MDPLVRLRFKEQPIMGVIVIMIIIILFVFIVEVISIFESFSCLSSEKRGIRIVCEDEFDFAKKIGKDNFYRRLDLQRQFLKNYQVGD